MTGNRKTNDDGFEEAKEILRKEGVDVDGVLAKLRKEKQKEQDKMELEAEFPGLGDIMTAELAYKADNLQDVYGREYKRRLNAIGLDEEKVKQAYELEKLILDTDRLAEEREKPWVRRQFLKIGTKPKDLPKEGQLTLTELIVITDEANALYWQAHEMLTDDEFKAVWIAGTNGKARYANAFTERAKKLGWTDQQAGAYIKNECLLTGRLRWGMHKDPAWTPETCDMKQYG